MGHRMIVAGHQRTGGDRRRVVAAGDGDADGGGITAGAVIVHRHDLERVLGSLTNAQSNRIGIGSEGVLAIGRIDTDGAVIRGQAGDKLTIGVHQVVADTIRRTGHIGADNAGIGIASRHTAGGGGMIIGGDQITVG